MADDISKPERVTQQRVIELLTQKRAALPGRLV
jgi:hypothetical protein